MHFLEKCLFVSFVHFTIGLFYFKLLACFLYISIHGLSDVCLSVGSNKFCRWPFTSLETIYYDFYLCVCGCVPSWIYVHSMSVDLRKSEDTRYYGAGVTSHCEPLAIVSHLTGILRLKLGSSAKAAAVLNCWAISPAQLFTFSLLHAFMRCNLMFYICKHYGTIKSR